MNISPETAVSGDWILESASKRWRVRTLARMPGLYRDHGVVLRTIKLGEADRIVSFMTQGNGKVRAVA